MREKAAAAAATVRFSDQLPHTPPSLDFLLLFSLSLTLQFSVCSPSLANLPNTLSFLIHSAARFYRSALYLLRCRLSWTWPYTLAPRTRPKTDPDKDLYRRSLCLIKSVWCLILSTFSLIYVLSGKVYRHHCSLTKCLFLSSQGNALCT